MHYKSWRYELHAEGSFCGDMHHVLICRDALCAAFKRLENKQLAVKASSISEVFVFQAQVEAQRATQEYQRAIEILRAAKETIALAEERLLEEDSRQFDSAWQEMLNHATQRVRDTTQAM